ncbi:MAG: hypothetical protein ACRDSE_00025 [Pseudonocardiaceae bacterium]
MNVGVGVLAGLAGLAAGIGVTVYALAVPAEGRLPRPSLSMLRGHRARDLFLGVVGAGLVSAAVGGAVGCSRLLLAYWLCGLSAVALAIIDLRRRRLPFAITGGMYLVCGVTFLIESAVSRDAAALLRATGIAALTLGGFLVLALALPGQLGLGDVVFTGWIVFSLGWFSWRAAVLGLVVGLLVQLAAVGVLGLGSSRSRLLPMGPALLAGWVVGLLITQG